MRSVLGKLLVVLLSANISFAYNPYLSSVNVIGCQSVDLGSSVNLDTTDFIDIKSMVNNFPRPGGTLKSRVCFKGDSNLFVQITDSKEINSDIRISAVLGKNNKQSYSKLNDKACGVPQNHGSLFSKSFYTCGYVSITLNADASEGTVYFTVEGLEPLQVSCTTIPNPTNLRYLKFGTNNAEVDLATIYYDCPLALVRYCVENDNEVKIGLNLNQNQSAVSI